jgi:nicotinate-nucleotide--dimethylbenzimidazole phosphoribosyltransferase
MIVGGILRAAENKMTILIDGFIVSVACLIAKKLYPEVMDYCFFSHVSSEKAHDILLRNLNVKPILNLDLRLGEGTGAALAYPILASSARFMHDMASFNEAGVSNRK